MTLNGIAFSPIEPLFTKRIYPLLEKRRPSDQRFERHGRHMPLSTTEQIYCHKGYTCSFTNQRILPTTS